MPKCVGIAGAALVIVSACLLAQSFLGSIGGIVTDPTSAVIPNAKVEATDVTTGTRHSATTNNEGRYLFPDLNPGTYVISVSAAGFKDVKSGQMLLTAQQTSRFDARLEVGTGVQTVEVTAAPPTLNTENAQVGDLRPREDLVNLPLDRRSTISFFFLTSSNYQGDGSSYSLGGLRGSYTNFTIDGISSNTALWGGQSGPMTEESFESVREMKTLESNNSAEFPGVGTVLISSRSGENAVHGSLFLTTNNNALNARCYYCDSKPKGPNRHEYGGSFGGPVVLPKIYDGHNKTFFYFTWEHDTFPAGGNAWTSQTSVPTLAMKNGNFSSLLPGTVIMDPATGKPFPGNIIPGDRISPVAQNLQAFGFLDPNYGPADGYINNWRGMSPQPESYNRWIIRGDHHIGEKDVLSGRASIFRDPMPVQYDSGLPMFQHYQIRNTRNAYASETHTFTPSLINEFRLGFSRDYSLLHGMHNGADVVSQVGLEGVDPNGAGLTGVPVVNFTNFSGMSEYPTYWYMSQTYELMNNVTWQKGAHNIKAGVLIRYNQPATSDWQNDFGEFNFNGFATGFDYADFLLGVPQSTSRVSRAPNRYNRYTNTGLFVQDAFNITPKLTLNFGLRWEYFQPPIDKNDMRYAFDMKNGNLVVPNQKVIDTLVSPFFPKSIPIVTAQQAGFPGRSLVNGDWKNFSPRFGFAYRLTNRTVVRGGYGIYYANLTYTRMDPFTGGPFASSESFTNSIDNGVPLLQFPNPFTARPDQAGAQSVSGSSPNLVTPRTHQWNLTIEHELGRSIVARVSYRGFRSTQIPYTVDLNVPPASADPNNNDLYRYPNYSSVSYNLDGGIQKMNALDVTAERKFSHGLTFQGGWTWAKNISDVGDDGESAGIENPYNRARDMGNVYWMPRHRFVANALWEIPFGRGKQFGANLPRLANGVLGNWQITAVTVMQTGQFLTPIYDGNQPNVRAGSLRPDCVGSSSVSNQSIDNWFNPGAFATPAAGMYGNCSRGIIVGPGIANLDLGLHKFFNLSEHAKLQVQARATNAFNHPNFGNPETDISAGGVGQITSTQGGRYDTLGARERVIRVGFRVDF